MPKRKRSTVSGRRSAKIPRTSSLNDAFLSSRSRKSHPGSYKGTRAAKNELSQKFGKPFDASSFLIPSETAAFTRQSLPKSFTPKKAPTPTVRAKLPINPLSSVRKKTPEPIYASIRKNKNYGMDKNPHVLMGKHKQDKLWSTYIQGKPTFKKWKENRFNYDSIKRNKNQRPPEIIKEPEGSRINLTDVPWGKSTFTNVMNRYGRYQRNKNKPHPSKSFQQMKSKNYSDDYFGGSSSNTSFHPSKGSLGKESLSAYDSLQSSKASLSRETELKRPFTPSQSTLSSSSSSEPSSLFRGSQNASWKPLNWTEASQVAARQANRKVKPTLGNIIKKSVNFNPKNAKPTEGLKRFSKYPVTASNLSLQSGIAGYHPASEASTVSLSSLESIPKSLKRTFSERGVDVEGLSSSGRYESHNVRGVDVEGLPQAPPAKRSLKDISSSSSSKKKSTVFSLPKPPEFTQKGFFTSDKLLSRVPQVTFKLPNPPSFTQQKKVSKTGDQLFPHSGAYTSFPQRRRTSRPASNNANEHYRISYDTDSVKSQNSTVLSHISSDKDTFLRGSLSAQSTAFSQRQSNRSSMYNEISPSTRKMFGLPTNDSSFSSLSSKRSSFSSSLPDNTLMSTTSVKRPLDAVSLSSFSASSSRSSLAKAEGGLPQSFYHFQTIGSSKGGRSSISKKSLTNKSHGNTSGSFRFYDNSLHDIPTFTHLPTGTPPPSFHSSNPNPTLIRSRSLSSSIPSSASSLQRRMNYSQEPPLKRSKSLHPVPAGRRKLPTVPHQPEFTKVLGSFGANRRSLPKVPSSKGEKVGAVSSAAPVKKQGQRMFTGQHVGNILTGASLGAAVGSMASKGNSAHATINVYQGSNTAAPVYNPPPQ